LLLLAGVLAQQQTPDAAHQHNQQRIALARSGNHLAAVKDFREAIAFRSAYAEANFNLVVSLRQLGVLDSALQAFRKAMTAAG
jgi:Flp pilus assembly protein TadD